MTPLPDTGDPVDEAAGCERSKMTMPLHRITKREEVLNPVLLRSIGMMVFAITAPMVLNGLSLLVGLSIVTAFFLATSPRRVALEHARYQLVHRSYRQANVIAASEDEAAGRLLLQAQATALSAAGARGQLVLVDRNTRHPVTWQVLPCQASRHFEG